MTTLRHGARVPVTSATPLPAATIGSVLDDAAAVLAASGFDESRREARRLVAAALGLSAAAVFAHPERALDAGEEARFAAALLRRRAYEPLSRIVGCREFWGLEFMLSADTLDPRPESETVVDAVLSLLPDRTRCYRFLDLGTGTGCLLLALLSECRAACGLGVDIASGAVATARRNAERLGLGDRAHFAVGDWAQAVAGEFDAVVANPPYIAAPEIADLPAVVRDHDPRRALDGGADGLAAYRAIAGDVPRLLRPGGIFATEVGSGQAAAVAALLAQSGLDVDGFVLDLAGISRVVVARR
ncbi:MAG TPA: peptide chain release factor N(5)-glutamine methyltransferase [Stellaceae bacterium]|nr:peptide chain release factor N(5)-glutamine methyltransferase [Stellaceae bacterium]